MPTLDLASGLLFLLAGVAFMLLMLWRPVLAVAGFILLEPYAFYRYVGSTTLTFPKVALLGMSVGLLIGSVRRSGQFFEGPSAWRSVALSQAVIVILSAISIFVAEHQEAALRETLKQVEYLLLFVVVASAVRRSVRVEVVLDAILFAAALVALLAISEVFRGAGSWVDVAGYRIPRIAGPLEGPNQLAGYLGITLPLSFLVLSRRARLGIASILLQIVALVLTLSRAGCVAALVAVMILAFARREQRARILTVLAIGFALGLGALGIESLSTTGSLAAFLHLSTGASDVAPGGVGTRGELWNAALALWRTHPLFGVGAGNFELELVRVGLVGVRTHANSWYLQALAEGGLLQLFATFGLLASVISACYRRMKENDFALAAFAVTIAFASHQIVDDLMWFPKVADLWWIALAFGTAAYLRRPNVNEAEDVRTSATAA
ncbi:MAG TPA: O-antigen ligase family protein [Candidatus Baltobacteraceae bacterium]|nr:O-antigen ligase family protein [Candidatus Baltobacteraceae bacterium]